MALALLSAWTVQAEGLELRPAEGTLSVSATGRLMVRPDTATVRLAVETTGESLALVQGANARRMQRVIARMSELGIQQDRIQTSSLQVIPHYSRRRQSPDAGRDAIPQIIGYTVRHALSVDVRELDRVGRIVDEALDAGANRFDAITWGLQDEHPVRLRALSLAARKARQKADALARVLGVKFLRVLEVAESPARPIRPFSQVASVERDMALEESGSVPVAPGELSVQSTVTLTFEIEGE